MYFVELYWKQCVFGKPQTQTQSRRKRIEKHEQQEDSTELSSKGEYWKFTSNKT